MTPLSLAVRIALPLGLAIVGLALMIAASGDAVIIGGGLVGIAVVLGISNVFYEVGRSEDRARAAEERRRRRETGGGPPT